MKNFNHSKLTRPIPAHVETNELKWCEAAPCRVSARVAKMCKPECATAAIRVAGSVVEFRRIANGYPKTTRWSQKRRAIWAHRACSQFDKLMIPGYAPNCILVSGVGGYATMAHWDNRWWIVLGVSFKYRWLPSVTWGKTRERVHAIYTLHAPPDFTDKDGVPTPYDTKHLDRFHDQCCQLLREMCDE